MQNDKNLPNDGTVQENDMIENAAESQDFVFAMPDNTATKDEADVPVDSVVESETAAQNGDVTENEATVDDSAVDGSVAENAPVAQNVDAPQIIETSETVGAEETSTGESAEDATEDSASPRNRRVIRKRNTSSRVYAGFFVRFTAYLLDKVIVGVPLVILRLILWMIQDLGSANILMRKVFFSFTLTDVILYLVSIAYFVLMTYFMGGTFGKRIMKLKVVSAEDRAPTFFEIAFREIIGRYLSAVILYIGYLMIGAGDQKEALHDYLADTRVVYSLD